MPPRPHREISDEVPASSDPKGEGYVRTGASGNLKGTSKFKSGLQNQSSLSFPFKFSYPTRPLEFVSVSSDTNSKVRSSNPAGNKKRFRLDNSI